MTTRSCCRTATQWIVPSVGLALIPKCPACIVAYIALATGFGISMTAASFLRTAAIVGCVVALLWIAGKSIYACARRPKT